MGDTNFKEKNSTQEYRNRTLPPFQPQHHPAPQLNVRGGDNPYLTNNRNPGTGVIDESA